MSREENALDKLVILEELRSDLRTAVSTGNDMQVQRVCLSIAATWLGFDEEQRRIMRDALQERNKQ